MRFKPFIALPSYFGGKRRLVPLIFARLGEVVPRTKWKGMSFVDPFLGGGSVSLYVKAQGLQVSASDIAERSAIVGMALIENSGIKLGLGEVCAMGDVPLSDYPNTAEQELVPRVLDQEQAAYIDRALHNTATLPEPKQALLKLVLVKWLLGLHPIQCLAAGDAEAAARQDYDQVSPGRLAHYVKRAGAPKLKTLWHLAGRVNEGVFPGRGRVEKADVFDFLPETLGDILYLDPPYPGTSSYEETHRILDLLLEGEAHEVSAFSGRTPPLDELLSASEHIPIWLLSMGNALLGEDELVSMLSRHRRHVTSLAIPFTHLPSLAGKDKNRENQEFIFVAWDSVP